MAEGEIEWMKYRTKSILKSLNVDISIHTFGKCIYLHAYTLFSIFCRHRDFHHQPFGFVFFFWMLLCPRLIRLNLTHDLMKIEKLTLPQIWYSPRIFKIFLNTSTFFLKTCIEFSLSLILSPPPFFSARQLDLWICSFFPLKKMRTRKMLKGKKEEMNEIDCVKKMWKTRLFLNMKKALFLFRRKKSTYKNIYWNFIEC